MLQFLWRVFSEIPAKVDSTSPRALLIISPHLRLVASWRPIESELITIWVQCSGAHKNDVWFSEEDEEENDSCWGVCQVFFCYNWTRWWKLDHFCGQRYTCRTKSDEKFFDGVIFVSWSLYAVPLFPSVHLAELAENKPQDNQWGFPGLFPLIILSVYPSPMHILWTPKHYQCLW